MNHEIDSLYFISNVEDPFLKNKCNKFSKMTNKQNTHIATVEFPHFLTYKYVILIPR